MKVLTKYTIKSLFKEKAKTIVTICGIILSTALITGVLSLVYTLKFYSMDFVVNNYGSYEAYIQNIDHIDETKIKEMSIINNVGYVKDRHITNQNKPYLYIISADDNLYEMTGLKLIEGKWPSSNDEIVIPKHLIGNTEIDYKIGQEITLDVGLRMSNNNFLPHDVPYEYGREEEIVETKKFTFKIVGIFERPPFEEYFAPVHTCITSDIEADSKDAFISFKNVSNIEDYVTKEYGSNGVSFNSSLLKLRYFSFDEIDRNMIIIGVLVLILMIIINFASILLIHNVFVITLSQRNRQYGLLKSIGATNKQISYSLFIETLCLSLIGIPIGIAAGLIGIEITLVTTTDLFKNFIYGSNYVVEKLHVAYNVKLILQIICLSLCINMFSSFFAYRKLKKIQTIDSLRQTIELDVDVKKARVSKFFKKHLSIEGLLALKSFKMAKKRYIAIIFSMILSIVLFLSASTLISYITKVNELTASFYSYDLVYYNSNYMEYEKLYDELRAIPGVEKSSIIYYSFDTCVVNKISNNATALNLSADDEISCINAYVDDETYNELVRINNHDNRGYMYYDHCNAYIFEDETYITYHIFDDEKNDVFIKEMVEMDGYVLYSENEDTYSFYNEETDKYIDVPKDKAFTYDLNHLSNRIEIPPLGIDANSNILVIIKKLSDVKDVDPFNIQFFFKTNDHVNAYNEMTAILNNYHLFESYIYDFGENLDLNDSTRSIIQIFSYGFVFIILLIGMLNISNTVSTNMYLKKREIAMLKSIGISKKSLYKIIVYESLIYGIISILIGLLLSIGMAYFIYVLYLKDFGFSFYMPLDSIIYIVLIVSGVVFVSLFYSLKKVNDANIIDILKMDIM